jgi:hypothetical protein
LWSDRYFSKTQEAATKMLEGIDKFLTDLNNIEPEENPQISPKDGKIFEEMISFFTADDWPFLQLTGQPALQISFQGENGK